MDNPTYYVITLDKDTIGGIITSLFITPKELKENAGDKLKPLLDEKFGLARLSMEMFIEENAKSKEKREEYLKTLSIP
jgi:hypothetical protein